MHHLGYRRSPRNRKELQRDCRKGTPEGKKTASSAAVGGGAKEKNAMPTLGAGVRFGATTAFPADAPFLLFTVQLIHRASIDDR